MIEYVRLIVFRNGLYLYYSKKDMDNVRVKLNIPLDDFSPKDIHYIKSLLKKGKFPTMLEPFREEIEIIKNKFNYLITEYKKENLVLPSVKEFRILIKNKTDIQSDNFLQLLNNFIEEKRKDFIQSPSSLKDFISFRNSILDYQLEHKCVLYLNSVNRDFVRTYFNFLQHTREPNKGFKTKGNLDGKTIKKRLDVLKYFIKWYSNEKKDFKYYNNLISILNEQTFNTKKITEEVKKVSLSLEQIKFLQELNIRGNNTLCKVRDMFVFVCQTGLRFSDLISLNLGHIEKINNQYYIYRQSKKTKDKFYRVEISDWLFEVFKKYNYNFNLMSNQKSNQYLRELLSDYEEFNYPTKYLNRETNKPFLFYEVITFHQGRRSFITNLLDNGYSIVEVMERTDHTKVSTLEKYVSSKGYGNRNILNLWSN
jgi:integrase